jgi:hypothetical protein
MKGKGKLRSDKIAQKKVGCRDPMVKKENGERRKRLRRDVRT